MALAHNFHINELDSLLLHQIVDDAAKGLTIHPALESLRFLVSPNACTQVEEGGKNLVSLQTLQNEELSLLTLVVYTDV